MMLNLEDSDFRALIMACETCLGALDIDASRCTTPIALEAITEKKKVIKQQYDKMCECRKTNTINTQQHPTTYLGAQNGT